MVVELQRELATTKEELAAQRYGGDDGAVQEALTLEELEELEREERERTKEHLELALNEETRDHGWASQTEDDLQALFLGDTFPGANLMASACASTMCKAQIELTSEEAKEDFFSRVTDNPPMDTNASIIHADGMITYYFARKGHKLP